MASRGTTRTQAPGARARLRWPLVASVLVHTLVVGGAVWWTAGRATGRVTHIGSSMELRPAPEACALAERELLEPVPLDECPELTDTLEQVVLDVPATEVEPVFTDENEQLLAQEPAPFTEIPLSAVRGRRPPPVAPTPAPRPTIVRVRPVARPPAPLPPRVAPSPLRRSPLRVVRAPDPRRYYPRAALRRGLGGRALVRLTINPDGRVRTARIERTSGHRQLDDAAISLAYAYRFTAGHGVRTTRLPVTFRPPSGGFGS